MKRTLAKTPFRSGCKIDRIEDDGIAAHDIWNSLIKHLAATTFPMSMTNSWISILSILDIRENNSLI